MAAINYLTLRSTIVYTAPGSAAPAGYINVVSTGGNTWTNNISINNGGFSTLTGSTIGIGTATPGYSLDVAGIVQGQTAFQSNTNANNVGLGALQQVYLGQYGAAAPRGTCVRWGDIVGAAYYANTGSTNLSFYKDVSGGNAALAFQLVGTSLTNATPNVYIPNSLGIGTNAPSAGLHLTTSSGMRITGGLTNGSSRPGLTTSPSQYEIRGSSNSSIASDDGYLLLSAGGGTNTTTMSYLALSGYSTVGDMNENIVLGTQGTERMRILNNGYVGIGTASPSYNLDINGNSYIYNVGVRSNGSDSILDLINTSAAGYVWRVGSAGTGSGGGAGNFYIYGASSGNSGVKMVINPSGYVGIGTLSPSYTLHVIGAIYASGDITALSDQRYKQNIVRLDRSLDRLLQVNGYSYTREDYRPGEIQLGLLAQEVATVFPEAVHYDETHDQYSLNYQSLIAPMIEAIKDLQHQLYTQNQTIQMLLDRLGPS